LPSCRVKPGAQPTVRRGRRSAEDGRLLPYLPHHDEKGRKKRQRGATTDDVFSLQTPTTPKPSTITGSPHPDVPSPARTPPTPRNKTKRDTKWKWKWKATSLSKYTRLSPGLPPPANSIRRAMWTLAYPTRRGPPEFPARGRRRSTTT
jgi:hypothetical protein